MELTASQSHKSGHDKVIEFLFPTNFGSSSPKPKISFKDGAGIKCADDDGLFQLSFASIVPVRSSRSISVFEGVPTINTDQGLCWLNYSKLAKNGKNLENTLATLMVEHAFLNLKRNPNICLAISMSAHCLADPAWQETFKSLAVNQKNDAKRLTLNFSESSLLELPDLIGVFLREYASSKIRFGICDFGSSFCSLRDLKVLPFDQVTLAPSLLQNPTANQRVETLLLSICDFCQSLGFETIACGVDNTTSYSLAQKAGCDFLQGTFFGPLIS